MELVQNFLADACKRSPDKLALVCGETQATYREFDQMSNSLGHLLQSLGVTRGDRIIILLPNGIEFSVCFFAVLRANAIAVPLKQQMTAEDLLKISVDCSPSIIVVDHFSAKKVLENLKDMPWVQHVIVFNSSNTSLFGHSIIPLSIKDLQKSDSGALPPCEVIDQDLVYLIYTSGSTGEPKGVMASHNNVVFVTKSITTYLKNTAEDVVFCAIPLSFDYGLYQLIMVVYFGGTLILEKSFLYLEDILQKIVKWRVTGFPIVPMILTEILKIDLARFNFSQLRYITNTAAALPVTHIQKLRKLLPAVDLYSMYGLTETKRSLYMPPEMLNERPGSVGIPIPGTEAWIVDENGNRLAANQIGELVVRGRHVMRGYWNKPDLSSVRFRQGLYPGEVVCYTGDLFYRDEAGYFYFVSRKDEMINTRGRKVAPRVIEDVLYQITGITAAAVVGVPDELLGQAIIAFVACSDQSIIEAQVIHYCRTRLEGHMVPTMVEICPSLPVTDNGKIDKKQLVERKNH